MDSPRRPGARERGARPAIAGKSSGPTPVRSAPATLALALALALAAFSPPPLAGAIRPDDCLAARRAETGHEAACYSLVQDGRKRTLRVHLPRARGRDTAA